MSQNSFLICLSQYLVKFSHLVKNDDVMFTSEADSLLFDADFFVSFSCDPKNLR